MAVRIVKLQAENIKRIQAVEITPTEDLVIVAGKNAQGKTSVLDSILMALGGKNAVPAEPLRQGTHKGQIVLDCGDFTATRKFTETSQQLILKSKNGQPIDKPQTFLDNIFGSLSFDPLEFSRMKPAQRLDTLLGLTDGLGERLNEFAEKRKQIFTERTEWNITVRNLAGQLADMEEPKDDWPHEAVDLQSFIDRKNELQGVIDKHKGERQKLSELELQRPIILNRIQELEQQLKFARKQHTTLVNVIEKQTAVVKALVDPDLSEIDSQLVEAFADNELARKRNQYSHVVTKKSEAEAKVSELTDAIEALDDQKAQAVESAELPITGLGFSDGDVRYNGVLFDQLSGAEQLRVSLAMAMAANPSMHVIRITNGSLLDDDNMAIVRQMAAEHDYQVWIECVGDRDDATVIIEDGKVK